MRTVDVVVVGLGPGGEAAASRLAEAGLEVVGIDAELVGGECPYWGCVPSKMMIRAANLLAEARRVEGMAGRAEVTADFAPVARRIREEATDTWDDTVAVERLASTGATVVKGWARLEGGRRVVVGDEVFEARRALLLNPGTRAWAPPIDGLAATPFWTNREAIETETVPGTLAVIGGGAIGVELGQVFLRFGARVTTLETAPRLLPPEEPEASALVTDALRAEGMVVHAGATITSVAHEDGHFTVSVEGVGDVVAERLLVATGRRPDLAGLGVGSIGLDESARAIPVDEHQRVADGVWAIGDVTGVGAFTHISMYQAAIAVADILGEEHPPADYRAIPRVTFTDPEVGSVGLTEAAARERLGSVRVGTSDVARSARGWIHKAGNAGFIKLVADADAGVLVGATSAGPAGGEVLSMLTLAVHARVRVPELRSMIYAYPTFHRAVEDALNDLSSDGPP
jgi:pyruvate/2-oxoglutarate dehydrogenase complex dihydrolipoamide dehydrogenase (E3) component